ncbi:NSFL1 cofactor p47 isoform X2 [Spodoptera frugiperda]|nr:NSFL1 cofactor p47 isoform X2 [Spodoptera frugiperda]
MESPPGSPLAPQKKDKKKAPASKFATLDSLQQESSSDEEEGQAFYAGGSERSGQQILGPSKGGRKDIVTEVFKSVRERGAVVFEDEPSSTSRGRSAFSGVGYRLGQTADDHEPATAGGNQQQQTDQPRSVRLRLYREGFTVDSGPLRHYTDPDHADFLNCIRRGEIPPELSGTGGEVRVSLEDRRHEECPRHIAKPQPFSGKGHLLGSPTPPTVGATAPVAGDVADRAANQRAAQEAVKIDDSAPVTTIQFRLADGSRLTGRFNHTHTVGDLHAYVSRAEPSYQLQAFALLTTFPSRELADHAATLAQANILNTTLLQRLK